MPAIAKRAAVDLKQPSPPATKPAAGPQIQIRKIETLIPYQRNARTHSEEQIAQVAASIREFGWTNPILLDSESGVIAGHARLAAARLLDLKQVPCIELAHLTEAQKRAYILADNKLALNAGWDLSLLAGELQDLKGLDFDLNLLGFGDQDLTELLAYSPGTEGLTDPDECPEVPENPVTNPGDLWILGKHRLLCGDATKAPDVEQLMAGEKADMVFTDPPYGVDYTGGAKKRPALVGDQRGTTIYAEALPMLRFAAADHAALYLWYADAHAAAAAAAAAGYAITAQIIWVKNNAQFVTAAHYKGKHEPCLYGHRKGKVALWRGENNEVTVWEVNRANKNEFHPTQKPVALAERASNNSSNAGHIVLDLFGGSGSTLIACEKGGRRCRMLELAPAYCDVIITRWQNFTGQEATLDGTKKTFAQISSKKAA